MGLIFKKSTAQPAFTVAAAITGTARVGQTLTCAYTATKARASNVTVRWYSYFDNVGTDQVLVGTGTTYVLTGNELGRYIRAIVTATNPAGAVQSTSSYTVAVTTEVPPDPPTVTSAAAITGTLEVGQTLTVSVTFSGATSTTYQWHSYTSAGGAGALALGTSTTQALTVAEDGKYIGCQATGTNASGSTVSAATLVGPVAANASEAPTVVSAAAIALDDGADGYNEGEYIICDAEFSGHTSTPTFVWYKCDAGKANPEELVGAGVEPIRPLPVSEPNAWRAALFLDQSLGLNVGGKYVYCVATAVNGEAPGGVPSESDAVGPIGAIQGTPIGQASVGAAPADIYYLNSAGRTYYLTEDVSFAQSGFAVLQSNITLNLNGHTITFDNLPTALANGDFELGASGWDWTTTGNAGAGVDAAGTTTYAQIFTSSDFTVDYNARKLNDGTKSLEFLTAACANDAQESYLKSETLSLDAGSWYCFSMQFSFSGTIKPVPFIRVRDSLGNLVFSRTSDDKNYSKSPYMYYLEGLFKATADPSQYVLEVGVTGVAGATGTVYIDDVRVCRARSAGVVIGPRATSYSLYGGTVLGMDRSLPPADVATYNNLITNTKVKNGTIVQGTGGSQFGTTFATDTAASGLGESRVYRVAATVHGPNSTHQRKVGATASSRIGFYDCTFWCNGLVSGNRDNGWGSALENTGRDVYRCRFYNYPISGILAGTSGTYAGNYFAGKARFTNGRAIAGPPGTGSSLTVHDNIVENVGEYYGRGIGIGGNEDNYTYNFYNNVVRSQPSRLNQEYGGFGTSAFGEHALQVEGLNTGVTVTLSGNTIETYALDDRDANGGYCIGHALRINDVDVGALLTVSGNAIKATAENGGYAYALSFGASETYQGVDGSVVFTNNAIESNSSVFRGVRIVGKDFAGGTIAVGSGIPDDITRWVQIYVNDGLTGVIDFSFVDCDISAPALARFAAAGMRVSPTVITKEYAAAAAGSVFIKWTITVATGVAGTAVTVTDKNGGTTYSGTANDQGNYVVQIPQYQTTGSTTIDWNAAGTSQNGWTFAYGGNPAESFTADAAKTVSH